MKKNLKTDLHTHLKHLKTPILHRIGFNETSIYLTKSYFHDLRLGGNDFGYYRLFSWDDIRAKAILGMELGDISPNLGRARLVGMFQPNCDDLQHVQYQTDDGKFYFRSAKLELSGRSTIGLPEKIDIGKFMQLGEIIPVGEQGKAIYGEGNYIIDGPAGTGKSTTALQKIKLLLGTGVIDPSDICLVVKNEKVVASFQGLLEALEISGISFFTADQFLNHHGLSRLSVDKKALENAKKSAKEIVSLFDLCTNPTKRLMVTRDPELENSDEKLKKIIKDFPKLVGLFEVLVRRCEELRDLRSKNRRTIAQMKRQAVSDINEYKRKESHKRLSIKKPKASAVIFQFFGSKIGAPKLTEMEEVEVGRRAVTFGKALTKVIKTKERKFAQSEDSRLQTILKSEKELPMRFFSEESFTELENNSQNGRLVSLYVNVMKQFMAQFHTTIIDEAHDINELDIELIRIHSQNTILTGDELQTESDEGVGSWDDLLNKEEVFFKNNQLNLFALSHNFRQSYELGSASFNYRQYVLGRPMTNIEDEYFANQKGFNKPGFMLIRKPQDFKSLINEKLEFIKESFTIKFPLVVFYENEKTLTRFVQIVESNGMSHAVETSPEEDEGVMFIRSDRIAGREFPVVVAPISPTTKQSTIYVMMSRARFDLTVVAGSNRKIDSSIQELIDNNYLVERV